MCDLLFELFLGYLALDDIAVDLAGLEEFTMFAVADDAAVF